MKKSEVFWNLLKYFLKLFYFYMVIFASKTITVVYTSLHYIFELETTNLDAGCLLLFYEMFSLKSLMSSFQTFHNGIF